MPHLPRQRNRTRALRSILWGALAVWAAGLGIFYLTRTPRAALMPGDRDVLAGLSGYTLDGQKVPLRPRDSAVAVLAATAECAACRLGVPGYREIALRLKEQGVAFRVVIGSDSLGAGQFARLIPQSDAVMWDPDKKLFRKLGLRVVPSLYLVGRDGRLRRTWTPLASDPRLPDEIAAEAREARGTAVTLHEGAVR